MTCHTVGLQTTFSYESTNGPKCVEPVTSENIIVWRIKAKRFNTRDWESLGKDLIQYKIGLIHTFIEHTIVLRQSCTFYSRGRGRI